MRVFNWANSKGILSKATPLSQHSKTDEEVNELQEALFAQNNNLQSFTNRKGDLVKTQDEIADAIGDVLVTVLIQCELQNLDPLDCLAGSLDIIEKRNGKMIDGVFVKE